MARRKGSHTSRVGSDKLHPDYIEHHGITVQSKQPKYDRILDKYDHPDETTIFYLGRTIDAMRVARCRGRGLPRSRYSPSSSGAAEDECSGLGMPDACWQRIDKHIRRLATEFGLSAKIKERYIDTLGIVYIEFFRKEKDV